MNTTSNEGLSNIYAAEPAIYLSVFPSPEQRQAYALQGGIAILFVATLIFTAMAVS